jgi:hypothetical protein
VKTAFLHEELEEDIYMDQPEGFTMPSKEKYVCKLKGSPGKEGLFSIYLRINFEC